MIFHFYSDFRPNDDDSVRRHALARQTWKVQPWHDVPIIEGQLPRMFVEKIPEKESRLPYLKDVFNVAMVNKDNNDIAVYTNIDLCVATDCCARIEAHLNGRAACYAFRRDFPKLSAPVPNHLIATGANYCGTDLFGFRVSWWLKFRDQFPDLLLAREGWDPLMRVIMEETNAKKGLAIPDISYHERHGNSCYWEDPRYRYRLPGQIHNLTLARAWLSRRGINPASFGM